MIFFRRFNFFFLLGAKKALNNDWLKRSPMERGRVLLKASQLLTERTKDLAVLETLNTSRAISETLVVDVKSASDCFEYFGGNES